VTGHHSKRRVGVNLLWLVPGVVGGSEDYIAALLHGVSELVANEGLELTLFVLPEFRRAHPGLAAVFPTVVAPVSGASRPMRVAAENSWLALQCRRRRLDLVHHAGGTIPFVRVAPSVVTIQDLQYRTYPEYFSPTKLRYLRLTVPYAARHSRVVTVSSEFVKSTIVAEFGLPPDRVVVIPHSAGAAASAPSVSAVDLRRRYDLDGSFFLYPAITYPHKNHLMLLEAFAELLAVHPEARLVLTGGAAQMEDAVRDRAAELGISQSVRRTGRIPSEDLAALYAAATAMVFPSRYEGFGLPVVEAMSRSCPVIAADVAALPEVVGSAGRLVAPDDPTAWAGAMREFIEQPGIRDTFIRSGLARADQFGAERSAQLLIDAYRLALS
jgi:glycosyltransferase involved in cell wall biosynthesis